MGSSQNYDYIYSFGMIDFFYLPQYSTSRTSTLLVISDEQILVKTLNFEPPELECQLEV